MSLATLTVIVCVHCMKLPQLLVNVYVRVMTSLQLDAGFGSESLELSVSVQNPGFGFVPTVPP